MSSLNLTTKQTQLQKLSPTQIQVIKILEIPSCDMIKRINEELQENPALAEGRDPVQQDSGENDMPDENGYNDETKSIDDYNYDDYSSDDDTPDYKLYSSRGGDSSSTNDIPFSVGMSFGEYLKRQIYLTKMDKPQRHIAKFVVGNIDEDGYLRRSIEELVDDINFKEGLSVSNREMEDIVSEIKRFDPIGVGAFDLCDCLLIQLRNKKQTPSVILAQKILNQYFDEFSMHHYEKICQALNIDDVTIREVISEIKKLNPKPGSAWAGTVYDRHQTNVIPDFIVENNDGQCNIQLYNNDLPELHVNHEYTELLEDYARNPNQSAKTKEAVRFAKAKIDAAKWFIDAIRQRNETLMKTMTAIVKAQTEFFQEGDEANLKPLKLQDIADETKYDVSTISRVSNSKYVQTEYGIFPLKFFFSEKITNNNGDEISTRELKKVVREIIDKEDKFNPINDDQLVAIMNQKGYKIARRTVAKYREQLGIPVARMRKEV